MTVREELERELREIPRLSRQAAPRGTGFVYSAHGQEIAHFHGDERVDVRLTRGQIARLKGEGAFDHRVKVRGPTADWVAVRLVEEDDVAIAVRLVLLAMSLPSE